MNRSTINSKEKNEALIKEFWNPENPKTTDDYVFIHDTKGSSSKRVQFNIEFLYKDGRVGVRTSFVYPIKCCRCKEEKSIATYCGQEDDILCCLECQIKDTLSMCRTFTNEMEALRLRLLLVAGLTPPDFPFSNPFVLVSIPKEVARSPETGNEIRPITKS